jgi:hypothetical protein
MAAKGTQKIRFRTTDGDGEAVKDKQNEPWQISMPIGDFRWHGSIPEVKREIERRNSYNVQFIE